jgi:hypothetical protein
MVPFVVFLAVANEYIVFVTGEQGRHAVSMDENSQHSDPLLWKFVKTDRQDFVERQNNLPAAGDEITAS